MTPNEYLDELTDALDEYRFDDVGPLTDRIDPADFNEEQVKKALNRLRRKRQFSQLEKAASLFFLAGHQAPVVRRQWAQALLDQNRVVQAMRALKDMLHSVADDLVEGPEVRGLLGRAYKQLYVNEGDGQNLVNAIEAYRQGWKFHEGDHRWHGINLVALLARAERDGVNPQVVDKAPAVAKEILQEIEEKEQGLLVWDYGNAMEASVALGDDKAALKWARKYARHPDADAFELAGTIRQMRELWKLEETELGGKLLPVLEYESMQRAGSTLELTAAKITDSSGFEAVYGNEGYVFVEWMEAMYDRCKSVARVFGTATGERFGTGFLMKGSDLRDQWGDDIVFVTNSHLISDNRADEAPLQQGDGSAEFTRLPDRPKIELGDIRFSSPRVDLDVTVLSIQPPAGTDALVPSFYPPAIAQEGDSPQRIYVMGHPKGAEMAVSLYDNSLAAYEGPYVRYRSPTEGGHSGSPVFTRQWKAFALHHRAREALKVNEGVLLGPIKEAVSA